VYQVYDIIILEEDTLQIRVIILTVTKKRSVTMNRGQVLAVDFENKKQHMKKCSSLMEKQSYLVRQIGYQIGNTKIQREALSS